MSKRIVTIVASIGAALAGGWLMLAPFALAYHHAGAAWNHPTEVDFWTGAGVLVLAFVALVASLAGVVAELRSRGALAPKPSRQERRERKAAARVASTTNQAPPAPPGQAPPAQPGAALPDLRELLAPLVLALLNDLQPGATSETPDGRPQDNLTTPDNGTHQAGPDPRPTPRSYS